MTKRIILYIAGLNCIAAAVVLNIRYDFGVAAFSSVMYSISEIYSISLGTASVICYLLFVAVQCILSKRITLNYALEIPLSFLFGALTDLYDFFIPDFDLHLALRAILFLLTTFVTAIGVFLCVKTDLVLTPTDGIVKTISDVFRIKFSKVKNIFDITMVATSALLCLINHTRFYGIGIGTVLSALLIGQIIRIYERYIPVSCFDWKNKEIEPFQAK